MRYGKRMFLAAVLLMVPALAWAGTLVINPAPTLGEVGLIALGVGLVGLGLGFLRKR